jgi:hypothetical protein
MQAQNLEGEDLGMDLGDTDAIFDELFSLCKKVDRNPVICIGLNQVKMIQVMYLQVYHMMLNQELLQYKLALLTHALVRSLLTQELVLSGGQTGLVLT